MKKGSGLPPPLDFQLWMQWTRRSAVGGRPPAKRRRLSLRPLTDAFAVVYVAMHLPSKACNPAVELAVRPLKAGVAAGPGDPVHLRRLLQGVSAVRLVIRGKDRGVQGEDLGPVGGLEQLDGGEVAVRDPGPVEDEVGIRRVLE